MRFPFHIHERPTPEWLHGTALARLDQAKVAFQQVRDAASDEIDRLREVDAGLSEQLGRNAHRRATVLTTDTAAQDHIQHIEKGPEA